MAAHVDDNDMDHLDKVDGDIGLCRVTTEYSPELYSSTSRVFTVIAKPRLLHALVMLCYGFQCLTASIAKTRHSVPSWSATAAALVSGSIQR